MRDPSDLRSKMGSYYTYFNTAGGPPAVTFSVPYYDLFGLSKFIKFLSLISSFGELPT